VLGPEGLICLFMFPVLFLTEELLNRCCFAKGSICFGLNPNLKPVENFRYGNIIFVPQFLEIERGSIEVKHTLHKDS
jgi:hypothetical protein